MPSPHQYERLVHQIDQIRRDHFNMHGPELHPAARETGPRRPSPAPIGLRAVIESLALAASEDAARGFSRAEPETPMAS